MAGRTANREINYLFDPYSLIGSLKFAYELDLSDADCQSGTFM